MTEKKYIDGVTPVGRMVSGAIFVPTDKGYQGKTLDRPVYYAQLAIPKGSPGLQELFNNLTAAAHQGFPNGEHARQDFSWKFKDGDAADNVQKQGWAGCYVFTFRSQFAPSAIVDANFQQIVDPNRIKPGYQVRISYSVVGNGEPSKPGIYLNLQMIQLVSEDEIIVTGPDPKQVFAGAAAPLPQSPGYAAPQGQPAQPAYPAPQGQPGQPAYQTPQGQPGQPAYQTPQGQPGQPAYQAPQGQPAQPAYAPDPQFLNGPQQ